MKDKPNAHEGNNSSFIFPFFNVRNISSPEDRENNRTIYIGHAPVSSIIDLPVNENVREYIVDVGKRRKLTQVHRAIKDTLQNRPEEFSVLNSGITLVARNCTINEKQKCLELDTPSIINGSQTQGVIRDFFDPGVKSRPQLRLFEYDSEPHVKFEVIVSTDEDLIAEVSIARNFQNDVKTISIVGRRGEIDELEERFKVHFPNLQLRKSETDVPYDDNTVVDTERLLQVVAALVPQKLWLKSGEFNKVYTYSQRAKCLKEFDEIYKAVHNGSSDPQQKRYKELYNFYLDIAGAAYELYLKWKTHPSFKGTRLRKIVRGEQGEIEQVPDGIIFPILAAHAVFAKKVNGRWILEIPPHIDSELIQQSKNAYQNIAGSNPNTMGKSKACYSTLYQITTLVKRYTSS